MSTKSPVYMIKLLTGEYVLSRFKGDSKVGLNLKTYLDHPLVVLFLQNKDNPNEQSIRLIPLAPYSAKQDEIELNRSIIIFHHEAVEEFVNMYEEVLNPSAIIQPKKGLILPG